MPLPNNRRSVSVGNNVFENLYVYGDCEFDKDVTINGQLKYDNLSVKNLEVTEKSTLGILTVTGNSTLGILTVTGNSTLGILTVTGNSNLGNVKISSGIVTASSGIVTYYGDGSNLELNGISLSESIWKEHPSNPISLGGSSSVTVSNLPAGIKAIRIIFHNVHGQSSEVRVSMNSSSVFWNHKSAASVFGSSTPGTSTTHLIVRKSTNADRGIFGVMEIHQEEDTGDWVEWNICTSHEYSDTVVQGRVGTGIVYPNVDDDVEEITFSYANSGNFSSGSYVYVYYIRG
jgi:hypothetical protein